MYPDARRAETEEVSSRFQIPERVFGSVKRIRNSAPCQVGPYGKPTVGRYQSDIHQDNTGTKDKENHGRPYPSGPLPHHVESTVAQSQSDLREDSDDREELGDSQADERYCTLCQYLLVEEEL